MLVDGVTINDGKDSLVGVCATPICINKRIADMAIKAVEAIRPVAIMVNQKVTSGDGWRRSANASKIRM
jgi:hypothetical protein